MLYGHPPSITHLRVFGCLSFAKDLANNDKIAPKGIVRIFLGYEAKQKGYNLYNLKNKSFLLSRDVMFYKMYFLLRYTTLMKNLSLLKMLDNFLCPSCR